MTETCVSQILYELNGIWRAIMRRETEAIKRKLTQQIQDLRRQLITKRAFDEEDAQKEISRLKKELQFAQKHAPPSKTSKKMLSNVSSHTTYKENKDIEDIYGSKTTKQTANNPFASNKTDQGPQMLKNKIN